ncbi:hypothetical protein LUZ60_007487 [Juncus effusus]|nr:hypothetical protein LUZ60_007487 [Juncus effusus]
MHRLRLATGTGALTFPFHAGTSRAFRSQAALDAIESFREEGEEERDLNIALYNYPSFTGAYAALFSRLFHSKLDLPFLVLPFSSVEPFRAEDLMGCNFKTCYLLDFIGPKNLSRELSSFIPQVIAFDHRQSTETRVRVSELGQKSPNLELCVDTCKSSAQAAYDYFSAKLIETQGENARLLNKEEEERIKTILKYIEDSALKKWKLSDLKYFNIGIKDLFAKLNCVTNPHVFNQLLEIDACDLIAKGKFIISSREKSAKFFVQNPFKIKLGRGFYGKCLAIRADGNSDFCHEIGLELSKRSLAAGLRPIGAVIYMQRGNLKMCLRSCDSTTDTSEIAKAYGGGGKSNSSSFTIRMDEYNLWTAANSSNS